MRFRISEPVFFLHKDRIIGEIMEAEVGPYRNVATGGGLQRIAQFVEMPDEIKEVLQGTAPAAPVAAKPTKPNPLAARLRALTARRAKFQDFAAGLLDTGEKHMTDLETTGPAILQRAVENAKDEIDAIVDMDDAMKQFAASNGGDPL